MFHVDRLLKGVISGLVSAVVATVSFAAPNLALAQGGTSLFQHEKYAAVVVDANTGEVLYARRADEARYPASITKIMTLYLTFEALSTGRLSPGDRIVVSQHAANQAPSKLGLRPGESLTVDEAMRAVTVLSANDIAVALAERIGGSESRFAALMTLRAQELGMTNTRFVNANGLPDARQLSSARDIAILSRAVMRDYPQYYTYFGVKSFAWRGRETQNHNHLLRKMPGVDGLKTGYTNAAGFNLAASAQRNGKRLIAVVLGGSSTAARDENVEDLLNGGFEVLAKRSEGKSITLASTLHEPEDTVSGPVQRPAIEMGSGDQQGLRIVVGDHNGGSGIAPTPLSPATEALKVQPNPISKAQVAEGAPPCKMVKVRNRKRRLVSQCVAVAKTPACAAKSRGKAACAADKPRETAAAAAGTYIVQVGSFPSLADAKAHMAKMSARFSSVLSDDGKVIKAGKGHYRARFSGFTQAEAHDACKALSAKGERCLIIAGS